MLFPGRNQNKFPSFSKVKSKKKKKKKGPHIFFRTFSYFHFQFFLFLTFPLPFSFFSSQFLPLSPCLPFTIFLLFISIFTPFPLFPSLFFPDTSAKISRSEVSGGHSAPHPPCYATEVQQIGCNKIFKNCKYQVCPLFLRFSEHI